jgi:hypothetical protein
LLYLSPREKDYPEYQNVVFARKGRTRVGKWFLLLGRVKLGWKIEVFGQKGQGRLRWKNVIFILWDISEYCC